MATQQYFLPESLDEAISLLAEHGPSLLVMAGGTLVMPLINDGTSMPEMVMGLRRAGLDKVERANGTVRIGATATISRVLELEAIPVLQEVAHQIGGWQIRNMGTVGGNLFAPPPAGDLAGALVALDSQVKLAGPAGERRVPIAEFFTGFLSTVREPGELVTEVQVPVPTGKVAYLKLGRKKANTPSVVSVTVNLMFDGDKIQDARVALNAAGPHPIRAKQAEDKLIGSRLNEATIEAAAAAAAAESEPFTDAIATEWYRREMVGVTVRRVLAMVA